MLATPIRRAILPQQQDVLVQSPKRYVQHTSAPHNRMRKIDPNLPLEVFPRALFTAACEGYRYAGSGLMRCMKSSVLAPSDSKVHAKGQAK